MARLGRAFSPLPVTTALLAGAALISMARAAAPAGGQAAAPTATADDEVAFAVPRLSPFGDGGGVAWPRPLPPSEAARARRILALQASGAIGAAERETASLDASSPLGRLVMGTVLADRYLGPHTRPDAATLRAWLARFPDLPDAGAIHALLLARLPRGAPPPAPPAGIADPASAPAMPFSPPVPEETGPVERDLRRNPDLDRSVVDAARQHGAAGVRRLLARTSGLSAGYASQLLGEAARALFALNRDEDAYALAAEGLRACARWPAPDCAIAAAAGLAGGLAAWRLDQPERAVAMFEAAWRARLTTPALRAAAAFWAGRTHGLLRAGDATPLAADRMWLRRAAAERDTFYGLLGQRALGSSVAAEAADAPETLSQADVDAVAATEPGLRAFALLQIDQPTRAEAELRRLLPTLADQPGLPRALMLVADHAGLPELAARIADLLQATDGRPREETRFRVPRLRPDGGFKVDPALIFAVARIESDFGRHTGSSAGARGIMQILPETADFITAPPGRAGRHASFARLREMLADPGSNLALGQQYLDYLAQVDGIDGNLIHLLASYNCGPGRFAQWSARIRSFGDPLLFIEAIPIDETRAYVPRVLTYTWLYARRLRRPTPSLDELARGDWPSWRKLPAVTTTATLH